MLNENGEMDVVERKEYFSGTESRKVRYCLSSCVRKKALPNKKKLSHIIC